MERRTALKVVAATVAMPVLAEASMILPCNAQPVVEQSPDGESWDSWAEGMARWERTAITQEIHRTKAESWQDFVRSGQLNDSDLRGNYRTIKYQFKYWTAIQWSNTVSLFAITASEPGARVSLDDAILWLQSGGFEVIGVGNTNCNRVAACFVRAMKPALCQRIEAFEFPSRPELPSADSEEEWNDVARRFSASERSTLEEAYPETWQTIRYQEVWQWNSRVTLVALMNPDRQADRRCDIALHDMLAYEGVKRLGKGTSPDGSVGWMFVDAPLDKVKATLSDWIVRSPTMPWDEPGYVYPDDDLSLYEEDEVSLGNDTL